MNEQGLKDRLQAISKERGINTSMSAGRSCFLNGFYLDYLDRHTLNNSFLKEVFSLPTSWKLDERRLISIFYSQA